MAPSLETQTTNQRRSSRVFTQFLSNILYRRPIKLVDGGLQKRSFTFIDDAIEAMKRAKASALSIDAGKTLMIEGEQVMAAADEAGIAVIGRTAARS